MLLAAFRLVIELFKGNKAASEAEDTMSQLSVGGASSLQGCHGWTFCVYLHLRVDSCSTGLCLISNLNNDVDDDDDRFVFARQLQK